MEQSRIDLMGKAPVKSAILKLAIPTMLAMAVQLIYNLTDTFFIGQTGDKNLVAAISIAGPIFMAIQAIGNIFANGSSSYISRMLGANDYKEAKRANAVAMYTAVGFGVVITVLLLTLKNPLLSIIGTDATTYVPTSEYLTILGSFSVALILQVSLAGLVRSEGATGKAMMGMVIGIGLNIVLDPIFILWMDMGTAGAAWATVIGNSMGALYYVLHFLSKKTMLSIKFKDFKPSKKIYGETFKIGIPSALSMAVMSVSFVLVNVLASGYGVYVVAGNGIEMRVGSMVITLVIGMTQGYQPFAGYNYGAKNYDRLKQGFKVTLMYSTVLSFFFTAVFILFGESLIGIFIDDAATVAAGTKILRAFTWGAPFFGIQMTMMVTFQATGKALKALVVSLGRQCIIYLPLLFTLNSLFGFDGFIYAQPIADILTTMVAVLLSLSFVKEMNSLHIAENKLATQSA